MRSRCYSELIELKTIQERYEYLKLDGQVGSQTFGFDRWLNQVFYRSKEWRQIRNKVIVRDGGWDLGVEGYPCGDHPMIHHMNPVRKEQVLERDPALLSMENLILCSFDTHEQIHYGGAKLETLEVLERSPNDQAPWKL